MSGFTMRQEGNPCQSAFTALPAVDVDSSEEVSVSKLLVTYILLVPLLVFSVHGGFSFEHGSWNSDISAVGGGIAVASSSAETVQERVQAWTALSLCGLAMFAYLRQIVQVASRMRAMMLLPAYAIVSAAWSQDAGLSFRSGVSLLFSTLFAFYLVSRFSREQQMQLVLLTGGCVAVFSVCLALGWPQYGIDHQVHEGAWQGLFTQKNVCAEVMLFLLTPVLALPCRGRYGQMLRVLYLFLGLLVILMTQSRTGWAATIVYLGFVFGLRLLSRFSRRDLIPLAAATVALAGAAVVATVKYFSILLLLFNRSGNFSGRSQIWAAVLTSMLKRPLTGFGFDAFWSVLHGEASSVFLATGWVVTSAHSGFLNTGLELGAIGILLVGVTFVKALRDAALCFRPGRPGYIDWCIGLVFLTLIYNIDERTLMATQYLPWMLYIVACTGLSQAAAELGDGATQSTALPEER